MKSCEYFEEQLSAWLDAELERAGQLEMVDHLVRCPSCRKFHVEARALDGLVATVREPKDAEPPSPEVWRRIREEAASAPDVVPRRSGVPAWAMRVAAVLVLTVGLGSLFWFGSNRPAEAPADAIVQLGEASGRMTDDRFVELTREVLRAEPRYRAAMFQVMQQVMRDTEEREASIEYDETPGAGGDAVRETDDRRLPV